MLCSTLFGLKTKAYLYSPAPLHSQDVECNKADANGWTALHYCAFWGGHERYLLAKALLDTGAEPNARSTSQRTPLHLACIRAPGQSQGDNKMLFVSLLCANGAQVDSKDKDGYTALCYSAENGEIRCMEALIDKNASLYATTTRGMSALHLAVVARRVDAVRLLCERDCEDQRLLNQPNLAGKTPLELCADKATRAATCNVWSAAYACDVEGLKSLLFAHYKRHDTRHEHGNQSSQPSFYINETWPTAGLDGKTAKSGMTPLHMAILGASASLKELKSSSRAKDDKNATKAYAGRRPQLVAVIQKRAKQVVQFLLSNDAFVDSLDKLCR